MRYDISRLSTQLWALQIMRVKRFDDTNLDKVSAARKGRNSQVQDGGLQPYTEPVDFGCQPCLRDFAHSPACLHEFLCKV
ncbi:hypothetical protein GX48_04886 [Paracoccidioides brasiliensis]|nr:hypothetical protein GX48_04886 [Paracoccidioides brasiliensis]